MTKRNYRRLQGLLLFMTLGIVGAAFYLQFSVGLHPCPLCLMQRLCAFLVGMGCLMGICLTTRYRGRAVAVFQVVCAALGLFFAVRQLWLQSLPIQGAATCLPGWDLMLRYVPWQVVMHAFFWGAGECAEVTWRLWGFSMPAWAAIYFFMVGIISVWIFFQLGTSPKEQKGDEVR